MLGASAGDGDRAGDNPPARRVASGGLPPARWTTAAQAGAEVEARGWGAAVAHTTPSADGCLVLKKKAVAGAVGLWSHGRFASLWAGGGRRLSSADRAARRPPAV